jgi:hypothetical protein
VLPFRSYSHRAVKRLLAISAVCFVALGLIDWLLWESIGSKCSADTYVVHLKSMSKCVTYGWFIVWNIADYGLLICFLSFLAMALASKFTSQSSEH